MGIVNCGSPSWYEDCYFVLRCLYGIMRLEGVRCWEWEFHDAYDGLDRSEYEELCHLYAPFLRFTIPEQLHDCMIINKLLLASYMKVFPVVPSVVPQTLNP